MVIESSQVRFADRIDYLERFSVEEFGRIGIAVLAASLVLHVDAGPDIPRLRNPKSARQQFDSGYLIRREILIADAFEMLLVLFE